MQATPTRGGQYTPVQFDEELYLLYSLPNMTPEKLANRILLFKQTVTAPARLAGGILLVHESLDQVKQPRDAWLYNPGQRRVRRAPQVAYDNPGTAADNMRTSDQLDMFNGAPDRYDWKLVGKREVYVPYNSYKLQDPSLKYKDIVTPLHLNPDHLRYELHRVWVVDATLRPGERHIYKRRVFYIDEDSWQILVIDQYDNRDQLWRVSEGHAMNFYNVPTLWTAAEVHIDLQAGRYVVMGLFNESRVHDFIGEAERSRLHARTRCGRRACAEACGSPAATALLLAGRPRWRPPRSARGAPLGRVGRDGAARARVAAARRRRAAATGCWPWASAGTSSSRATAAQSWTQAKVPTRALLTGVYLHDSQLGWAVGHDEVVLRTRDGGATWERVHYAPENERPLLDVWFADAEHGLAASAPTASCSPRATAATRGERAPSATATTST